MSNGLKLPEDTKANARLAKIAEVVDDYRVVINIGRRDDVKIGQRFLIYKVGDEIHDPDSGESLGKLEIIKGIGEVTHVQERMSTLQTIEKHEIQRKPMGLMAFAQSLEVHKEPKAFIDPEIGDTARPLN